VALPAGGAMDLPPLARELALYVVHGALQVDGDALAEREMAVLPAGQGARVAAAQEARLAVIGGDPLDAPRHLWWNFVSSRKDRILQASADWEAMRMGTIPGDDREFIPLPPVRFKPPEPMS
jgi:redox-sensitive bicupin YhaK (pirin superfamily)